MDYNAVIKLLDEYAEHFEALLKFEYSKLEMIHKGEIEKLSDSLSVEQAFVMKTNTLETRREKLLGKGVSIASVSASAPEDVKPEIDSRHKRIKDAVFRIKELNDTAALVINERRKKLRAMETVSTTYDGRGEVRNDIHNSTLSTNA